MSEPTFLTAPEALRTCYERAGLTQAQLSKELKDRGWSRVGQAHISDYARGVVEIPEGLLAAVEEICDQPAGCTEVWQGLRPPPLTWEDALLTDPQAMRLTPMELQTVLDAIDGVIQGSLSRR